MFLHSLLASFRRQRHLSGMANLQTNSALKTVALFGLVCLAVANCGPSINDAAKSDIDRRVAALRNGGPAFTGPLGFAPKPLAVGQWTTFKMTDEDKKPSFLTHKITGQQGNAFWFETTSETYYGKTTTAILLDPGDRTNPASMDIQAVKTKDADGRVNEMPKEMLGLMRSMWQQSLAVLVVTWEGKPQEDASVPGGTFAQCFKAKTDAAWGPFKSSSMVWAHSEVPISGTVKTEGLDKPFSMELVQFGESGAKSDF